ncbi:hypothetical protein KAR48_11705 [bacterium]|nr:hypothetical protein [bacterium]
MKKRSVPYIISLTMPLFLAFAADQAESRSLIDHEGYTYKTVKIGEQVWMAENLKTEFSPEGLKPDGIFAYENDERHAHVYGRLYTHEAAVNLCPEGWKLPSQLDIENLVIGVAEQYSSVDFKSRSTAGILLKGEGAYCWRPSQNPGLDTGGFDAIPAGYRNGALDYANFCELGETAVFWSSTASQNRRSAWSFGCRYDQKGLDTGFTSTEKALSVRYLLDE